MLKDLRMEPHSRDTGVYFLRLPEFVRRVWIKVFPVTGYEWFGLVLGRTKMGRYTCVGSVQELLWRMGITLDRYFGTGILGLGTTVLDPIITARFFDLKCCRLVTEAEHQDWLADSTSPIPAFFCIDMICNSKNGILKERARGKAVKRPSLWGVSPGSGKNRFS